jgi:hypothetical protein
VERRHPVEAVVIDGHVWLRDGQPGLGARLHEALGARIAVIGVAKAAFAGGSAVPVLRGGSSRPLFVTATGMNAHGAAELVRGMHGPHRLPTLLKRADRLARGHAAPDPAKTLAGPDELEQVALDQTRDPALVNPYWRATSDWLRPSTTTAVMTKRAFDTSRRWAAQPIPMSCDTLFVCPETRHCRGHVRRHF